MTPGARIGYTASICACSQPARADTGSKNAAPGLTRQLAFEYGRLATSGECDSPLGVRDRRVYAASQQPELEAGLDGGWTALERGGAPWEDRLTVACASYTIFVLEER